MSQIRKQDWSSPRCGRRQRAAGRPRSEEAEFSDKDLAVFTRQFSVMIDSGLPLVQCLEALASQQTNKNFQKVLFTVRGTSKADRHYPMPWPNIPRRSPLSTPTWWPQGGCGILDIIMQRLSIYIEKAYKLKSTFKSALVYPTVVITAAILIIALILWKVIPTFASLFKSFGSELPLPTKIVIALSNFMVTFGWVIFLIVIPSVIFG
ncbi:MAG: hypothetical protein MZV49_04820 [Rhodopseudomonas palustris]|nr:hypothetical protein [Rhodopseudomonas palustris]